jgi:hypothetical protein
MHTLPRLTVIWVPTRIDTSGMCVLSAISRPSRVPVWGIPHLDTCHHISVYAAPTCRLTHALWRPFVTGPAATPRLRETILALYGGDDVVAAAAWVNGVAAVWQRMRHRWSIMVTERGGAGCMPREEYCYSCGSEVERYEFTECKACHEYFCEDCVNEEELCDQCNESAAKEEGR